MMGVSGLSGDPAFPPTEPPMPPLPLGSPGALLGEGDEQARLALVAVGHHDRHDRLRGARALHQSRPLHARLRAGRQGLYRHHLLAGGDPRRRRTAHALPGARDHDQRARHGLRRRSITTPTASSSFSRRKSSSSPATASARRGCCSIRRRRIAFPTGCQFLRPGRQEPDVPPLRAGLRLCRGAARQQSRAADSACGARNFTRPISRAISCAATRSSSAAASAGVRSRHERGQGHPALGRGSSSRLPQAQRSPAASAYPRSARICRRSTTASRSIPC